jgi:transcriptional regulator with XRE-family HTH domain
METEREKDAALIRRHRAQLQMSQREYGQLFGVSGTVVGGWEDGTRRPHRDRWPDVLARINRDMLPEREQGRTVEQPKTPARQWLRFWVEGRPATFLEYQPGEEVHMRLATPEECASRNGGWGR